MTLGYGAMPWPLLPPGSSYPPPPGAVPGRIVRVGPRQYRAMPVQPPYGWWSPVDAAAAVVTFPFRTADALSERSAAATEIDRAKKGQPLQTLAAATNAATMSTVAATPGPAYFRAAWWLAVAVRLGAPRGLLATADNLLALGSRALVPTPGSVLPRLPWQQDPSADAAKAAYRSAYALVANVQGVPPEVISGLSAGANPGTPWVWLIGGALGLGALTLGAGALMRRRGAK